MFDHDFLFFSKTLPTTLPIQQTNRPIKKQTNQNKTNQTDKQDKRENNTRNIHTETHTHMHTHKTYKNTKIRNHNITTK